MEISAKLRNSNAFSAQKQVISKKKKVFTEIETDFQAKIGNSNAFSGRITTFTSQLRHPISFGGAVFIFSPKIGLKSTKNVRFCILYRPKGGSSPPPPLATLLDGSMVRYLSTVRYASIFAKKYGTLVRYAFFKMVRVRYASKVELKYGTLVRYGTVQGARYVVRKF